MATDGSASTGTAGIAIRAITGVGAGSATDQQVVSLARNDGTLEAASAAGSIATQNRVQSLTATSGTITTSTGVVTATTDVSNAGSVTVLIVGGATGPTGLVLNFEASPDGTNWAPVMAQRSDTYEIAPGGTPPTITMATGAVRAWDVPMPGYTQFRVRASALVSGSVAVIIAPAVNPFEIAPSVGVAAAPAFEWQPADVTSITTLGSIDASQYQSIKVQLAAPVAWSGVSIAIECSNDNSVWTAVSMVNSSSTTGAALTSISFVGQFYANLTGRYLRIRTTAYTSGTVRAIVELSAQPISPHAVGVTVNQLSAAAALADAFTNPTEGHVAADPMLFNGASWDRYRNNSNAATGDTGTKTVTFNGATQINYNGRGVALSIILGTVSGTTPTLVAKMQGSADGGTTWYDIGGATTGTIAATGTFHIEVYPGATVVAGTATSGSVASTSHPVPRTWRLAYTIGGTSPSFAITSVQATTIN